MKQEFIWYRIRQFPSTTSEKYDDTMDRDLRMLCDSIPDFMIAIFKLEKSGTSMYIRVPLESARQVESVPSFGKEEQEYPITTKISALAHMKLRKKSVYPLVTDVKDMHQDIFSLLATAPYGAFYIRLLHANSSNIKKQFDSLKKKHERQKEKQNKNTNWYESPMKSKAECSLFFYAEVFYATKLSSDIDLFESVIPYTDPNQEPNGLVRSKLILSNKKHPEKATASLKKLLLAPAKKTQMTLSQNDIVPFVRFPHDADHLQMDSATTDTFTNFAPEGQITDPQRQFEEDTK